MEYSQKITLKHKITEDIKANAYFIYVRSSIECDTPFHSLISTCIPSI